MNLAVSLRKMVKSKIRSLGLNIDMFNFNTKEDGLFSEISWSRYDTHLQRAANNWRYCMKLVKVSYHNQDVEILTPNK